MKRYYLTGQSPQRAVAPMEEEGEEDEEYFPRNDGYFLTIPYPIRM